MKTKADLHWNSLEKSLTRCKKKPPIISLSSFIDHTRRLTNKIRAEVTFMAAFWVNYLLTTFPFWDD